MKSHKTLFGVRTSLCVLAAWIAAGCLQADVNVKLRHDGGAVVTERLRLSRALLDLDKAVGGPGASAHLERAAAQERLKSMGKGVALESHELATLPDGSRESVALYTIPDVEDLRLPNPYVQDRNPAPMVRLQFRPNYGRPPRHWSLPVLSVNLVPAKDVPQPEKLESVLPPSATPVDQQVYRDLKPVFADLLQDFQLRVTLTVPDQPRIRATPAGDRTLTLLNINDQHADRHAELFFQNEEAMLALMQFSLSHDAIISHTKHFPGNPQVPVHRGRSAPYHSSTLIMRPTKHQYQKYYAGRPKSEGGDR